MEEPSGTGSRGTSRVPPAPAPRSLSTDGDSRTRRRADSVDMTDAEPKPPSETNRVVVSAIRTRQNASVSPAGDVGRPSGFTPLDAPALRLTEVARRLAISRAAAYRLVRSGRLRGIQVGETWRVLRADFDAYVEARRAEAERRYRAARTNPDGGYHRSDHGRGSARQGHGRAAAMDRIAEPLARALRRRQRETPLGVLLDAWPSGCTRGGGQARRSGPARLARDRRRSAPSLSVTSSSAGLPTSPRPSSAPPAWSGTAASSAASSCRGSAQSHCGR